MSDLQKPKKPKRPDPPPAKPKPKLELIRITPAVEEETKKTQVSPIPPPTELLQYRAIGLIEGRFVPEEEEPNKGTLVTRDGGAISSVILGKMMTIVKRKLPIDRSYLWVVYPRTQTKNGELHLQITGVWAPVELGKSEQPIEPGFPEGHFSIRGEVVQVEPDRFVVKVKRTDAKASVNRALRKFKLRILGVVPPDRVGYFWDLLVRREGNSLCLVEGKAIEFINKKPQIRKKVRSRQQLPVKPQRPIDRPKPRKPQAQTEHKPGQLPNPPG